MSRPQARPPALGILEWFRPGEHERVESTLDQLQRLGIRHLRTGISWADYHRPEIEGWYDWLLPRLGARFELLPCVLYVPPSISMSATTAGPPDDPKAYADFLDLLAVRYGDHFETIELWNEPNNLNDWDWRLDPSWDLFTDMLIKAAYWMRRCGKRTVLGGTCPTDLNWLSLMAERGALTDIDVVGLHGFPGTWQAATTWQAWDEQIEATRALLDRFDASADIWITETGYSTWRHDELAQIDSFVEVMQSSVARVYWYAFQDLHPSLPSQEGWHFDERHYHFGLVTEGGRPKLLHRMLEQGGTEAAENLRTLQRTPPAVARKNRSVVITGGAGFLGTNLADRLASEDRHVLILDSLRRQGVEDNLAWLKQRHPRRIAAEIADIRDPYVINHALVDADAVFHFAAQVAVTTSLADPVEDFDTNLKGTLNLLEALRHVDKPPPTLFASTNKVYGNLEDIALALERDRYVPQDRALRGRGIGDDRALSFCSPYGCSKGAADQYVLDYARSFGLPTAVLRMSCLYGPHQLGTEDQGWVAHFLLSALEDRPITIYGDGRQVRDILYVDDAIDAYLALLKVLPAAAGRAFNLGGGRRNAVSLIGLIRHIERLIKRPLTVTFDDWRTGDQRYYVSDASALGEATGWEARTAWQDGVARLLHWLRHHRQSAWQAVREEISA
jgi:CDP-paratose 2-epimerase